MEQTLPKLSREDIRILHPKIELARAKPGQVLVKELMNPIGIFILQKGSALVKRKQGAHDITVATLGPGDYFGETAFLDSISASATVVAEHETDLLILRKDRIIPLFESHPDLFGRFFQSIALIISRRLRAITQQAGEAKAPQEDRWGKLPNWEII